MERRESQSGRAFLIPASAGLTVFGRNIGYKMEVCNTKCDVHLTFEKFW